MLTIVQNPPKEQPTNSEPEEVDSVSLGGCIGIVLFAIFALVMVAIELSKIVAAILRW